LLVGVSGGVFLEDLDQEGMVNAGSSCQEFRPSQVVGINDCSFYSKPPLNLGGHFLGFAGAEDDVLIERGHCSRDVVNQRGLFPGKPVEIPPAPR